jgi:hypothetical protein
VANFPDNLPGFWDHQWGFLHNDGTAPVWVGEWGAVLDNSVGSWSASLRTRELQWFTTLKSYIMSKGLSWTWWTWTPESADTHGILKDDYSDVNASKLSQIAPAMYAGFSSSGGGTPPPPPPPAGSPYGGTARAVPGTIQAEDFDDGGEGVGYHDSDAMNSGGQYRATGVDVEATADAGGGNDVGWLSPGEWLQYTVNVGTAGNYDVTFRVASALSGGAMHLQSGTTNLTGSVAAPGTGGWQTWTSVTASNVALSAGTQSIRLVFDSGSFNMNSMAFALTSAAPPPSGPPGGSSSTGGKDGGGGGGGGCGLTGLEAMLILLGLRTSSRGRAGIRRC